MKRNRRHEETGTARELRVAEVMAEALAILEPAEPYYEFHTGKGTGLDLNAAEVIGQVDALLAAAYAALPAPEAAVPALP